MKKTKAVLALLMAGTMMLGVAGCGGSSSSTAESTATGTESTGGAAETSTDAAARSSVEIGWIGTPVD